MVSKPDKWRRIFQIPETSRHRKGFTIYKIISLLYPESSPEAVTKIVVWKRFNDFKKLYHEMSVLHQKFTLSGCLPTLPITHFYQKVTEAMVAERRQRILVLLDYIGTVDQLFTSEIFVRFFETSHNPTDQTTDGTIKQIRADLELPNSDNDDSTTDMEPILIDNRMLESQSSISTTSTLDSLGILEDDLYTLCSLLGQDVHLQEAKTYEHHLIDAFIHMKLAKELELCQKYEEAHQAFGVIINLLEKYEQNEEDYDKRRLCRFNLEKCMIRRDKIHNMHLDKDLRALKQLVGEPQRKPTIENSELHKYKVIKCLKNGIQVTHIETQQLYYVKSIRKSNVTVLNREKLFEKVPYMVQLHDLYDLQDAIFLIMDFCNGIPLQAYLKDRNPVKCGCNYNDDSEDEDSDLDVEKIVIEMHQKIWTVKIFLALEALQSNQITWADFNIDNVLIDPMNRSQLTVTYGLLNATNSENGMVLAPELSGICMGTVAVNWWAYGLVLYEIFTGYPLVNQYSNDIVKSCIFLKIPQWLEGSARDLLKQLLVSDPVLRMRNVENLKEHPFFNGIDWNVM